MFKGLLDLITNVLPESLIDQLSFKLRSQERKQFSIMGDKRPIQITLAEYQGVVLSSEMDPTAKVLLENLAMCRGSH
jgi:hypothetical protein